MAATTKTVRQVEPRPAAPLRATPISPEAFYDELVRSAKDRELLTRLAKL